MPGVYHHHHLPMTGVHHHHHLPMTGVHHHHHHLPLQNDGWIDRNMN
jgi:hypothetical protein